MIKKGITAIIPARSGSKRIKDKNIYPINGNPLIFYTLDALLDNKNILEIIFTSDSDKYNDLVKSKYYDKIKLLKRPIKYAGDKVKVYEEIKRLANIGEIKTEWFMLCLPTSPLRDKTTVKKFLDKWKRNNDAMFTASPYSFPIQFAFDIDNKGNWKNVFSESPMITGNTRSQDIKKKYRPNGAIYLQETKNLNLYKTFYQNAQPYVISENESIDIDSEIDLMIVEQILKKKN